MDANDWENLRGNLDDIHRDIQAIHRVNQSIEEHKQFIHKQMNAIKVLRHFLENAHIELSMFSNIRTVWEASLYFMILRHDLFIMDVNIKAQQYMGLHHDTCLPLYNTLATQCHEFLSRFNQGIFHDGFWQGVAYIETSIGKKQYQVRLGILLKEFRRQMEPHKKPLADMRNALSHRDADLLGYYADRNKLDEGFILARSHEIIAFCSEYIRIYSELMDVFLCKVRMNTLR